MCVRHGEERVGLKCADAETRAQRRAEGVARVEQQPQRTGLQHRHARIHGQHRRDRVRQIYREAGHVRLRGVGDTDFQHRAVVLQNRRCLVTETDPCARHLVRRVAPVVDAEESKPVLAHRRGRAVVLQDRDVRAGRISRNAARRQAGQQHVGVGAVARVRAVFDQHRQVMPRVFGDRTVGRVDVAQRARARFTQRLHRRTRWEEIPNVRPVY